MDSTRYDNQDDFGDYEYYDSQTTNIGLPPSQLALIIGVNAVVSLIISVVVVLIANRQVIPGDVATPAAGGDIATSEVVQGDALPGEQPTSTTQSVVPAGTPIESVVYVVEAGDSLGVIADKFSVSLFDVMIANGLTNEDFIQVGQELTIPLGGLPTATPTFTPVPIPTDTPLPFDPPTPLPDDVAVPVEPASTVGPSPTPLPTLTPTATISASGLISTTDDTIVDTTVDVVAFTSTPLPTSTLAPFDEVNVGISEISSTGDLLYETLVILNQGAGTSLNEWQLEGSPLGIFIFPDIFLFSGGSIRVHTTAGQNTPSDLYLNQGESAWPSGTTITLRDADGNVVSLFTVP